MAVWFGNARMRYLKVAYLWLWGSHSIRRACSAAVYFRGLLQTVSRALPQALGYSSAWVRRCHSGRILLGPEVWLQLAQFTILGLCSWPEDRRLNMTSPVGNPPWVSQWDWEGIS